MLVNGVKAAQTTPQESVVTPILAIGELTTTSLAASAPAVSSQQVVAANLGAGLAISNEEINISDLVTPGTITNAPAELSRDNNDRALQQIDNYNNEVDTLGQVTNITQLRDVSPRAWAFEALRNLVERYQCIQGYPDGTFRGDRALTRFEFAAGLNACLRKIESLIADRPGGDVVTRADLEAIRRLTTDFRTELTALGTQVNALDGRVTTQAGQQFSTTTKLRSEIHLSLSSSFGSQRAVPNGQSPSDPRPSANTNIAFGDRIYTYLFTSFTGRDLLSTGFLAGNTNNLSDSTLTGTNMTRFLYDETTNNFAILALLQYRFSVGAGNIYLSAVGGVPDDGDISLSPLTFYGGSPTVSRFSLLNPIYRLPSDAGLTFDYPLTPVVRLTTGYQVPRFDTSNPGKPGGIFNGQYTAYAQLTLNPIPQGRIAFTYANTYLGTMGAASAGTGSTNANRPYGASPTSANAYSIEAQYNFSPSFTLSGWVGYTNAINEGSPFKEKTGIWNYAVVATFPDLGARGNTLGIIAGVPPRAGYIPNSPNRDYNTSLHLEAFYNIRVNDYISITPDIVAIFNPEHNKNNSTIVVTTIRTLFRF